MCRICLTEGMNFLLPPPPSKLMAERLEKSQKGNKNSAVCMYFRSRNRDAMSKLLRRGGAGGNIIYAIVKLSIIVYGGCKIPHIINASLICFQLLTVNQKMFVCLH